MRKIQILPWRESPENAFQVWDIHTIMNWDGDGFADRIIRWGVVMVRVLDVLPERDLMNG
jgi:hypothetical protein